jgi:hypothetical protein
MNAMQQQMVSEIEAMSRQIQDLEEELEELYIDYLAVFEEMVRRGRRTRHLEEVRARLIKRGLREPPRLREGLGGIRPRSQVLGSHKKASGKPPPGANYHGKRNYSPAGKTRRRAGGRGMRPPEALVEWRTKQGGPPHETGAPTWNLPARRLSISRSASLS